MTTRDLFGKKKPTFFENATSASNDIESSDYAVVTSEEEDTFLPHVDFSSASNFVKFGSAEYYYENSIKRVYQQYPYDGSFKEKTQFQLSSSYLDRWLYENKYPKTTGYVILGTTQNYTGNSGKYGIPTTSEYISIHGGMQTASAGMEGKPLSKTFDAANKYNLTKGRTKNLRLNFASGSTVEFWLKKDAFSSTSNCEREVIFDVWNGEVTGTAGYGRLMIESINASSGTPFRVTIQSGTVGDYDVSIGNNITKASLTSWQHYAFSFQSQSNGIMIRFYVNGAENASSSLGSSGINEITGALNAHIGGLIATPSDQSTQAMSAMKGYGKLSASLDEFRFWKTRRTSRQINMNWYYPVGGGSNTDDSTTDLTVYYKFNEGITGTSSTDSTVLDYSGRIANGVWTGYPGAAARNTGSAMVSASVITKEPHDPIIYSSHTDVVALLSEMQESGSLYDNKNSSYLYNTVPAWIRDDDEQGEENIRKMYQIISSHFDTIYAQITALPSLKDKKHTAIDDTSSSFKPYSFSDKLLTNYGFKTEPLFSNSSEFEKYARRDTNARTFDLNLADIKNIVYENIYNNLEFIYKSKGTTKSIRNLIRCFGIDDELVKLNAYSDGGKYYFRDNVSHTSYKTKYLNLNQPSYFDATIYNTSSANSNNPNTFISGSEATKNEIYSAFTIEADIIVPYKKKPGQTGYFETTFTDSSIFGFYRADKSDPADYTWQTVAAQKYNLQAYLVRDKIESEDAYFKLVGSFGGETINLTSEYFKKIYNNERWNLAVRLKPVSYPFAGGVNQTSADLSYQLEFYGVNYTADVKQNEFSLTHTIADNTKGQEAISAAKRIYAGARRENFTGTVQEKTDLKIGGVRFWLDYIEDSTIQMHALDYKNYGNTNSFRNGTIFNKSLTGVHIPQYDLLALDWRFDELGSSDGDGNFIIDDFSSGSTNVKYGWVDGITRREHRAKGQLGSSAANKTDFVSTEFIFSSKKQLPENALTNDDIFIKGDTEIYFSDDDDSSDRFYNLEKSMYQIVSDEMLRNFGSVAEFNNLVGKAHERYRFNYKNLDHVKKLFFEKLETDLDFDRFVEYYKWIDASMSSMVSQLIPASSRFNQGILNVVESHILERNKYQNKFPLTTRHESTEVPIRGINELNYNWKTGHAPLGASIENQNCVWQKERKERGSDTEANKDRESIRKIIISEHSTSAPSLSKKDATAYSGSTYAVRRFSKPYRLGVQLNNTIHAGINYSENKDPDFLYNAVHLHGPVFPSSAPENIIGVGLGAESGLEEFVDCKDDVISQSAEKYYLNKKRKWSYTAEVIRHSSEEYLSKLKGSFVAPINLISGSVSSGYNKLIYDNYHQDVTITNIHSDVYTKESDMGIQGPFTNAWVGGHAHRHVDINRYESSLSSTNFIDDSRNRPEAWKFHVATVLADLNGDGVVDEDDALGGAFGFTGPDYFDVTSPSYPNPNVPHAVWYREEKAKRPVNIKNIKTELPTVNSEGQITYTGSFIYGNYSRNYEVVQTMARSANNLWFRRYPSDVSEDPTSYGLLKLLPTTTANALPKTTHYITLVGQAPYRWGSVGRCHLTDSAGDTYSNRMPDGIEEIMETIIITSQEGGDYSTGSFLLHDPRVTHFREYGHNVYISLDKAPSSPDYPDRYSFKFSASNAPDDSAQASDLGTIVEVYNEDSFWLTPPRNPFLKLSGEFVEKFNDSSVPYTISKNNLEDNHPEEFAIAGQYIPRRPVSSNTNVGQNEAWLALSGGMKTTLSQERLKASTISCWIDLDIGYPYRPEKYSGSTLRDKQIDETPVFNHSASLATGERQIFSFYNNLPRTNSASFGVSAMHNTYSDEVISRRCYIEGGQLHYREYMILDAGETTEKVVYNEWVPDSINYSSSYMDVGMHNLVVISNGEGAVKDDVEIYVNGIPIRLQLIVSPDLSSYSTRHNLFPFGTFNLCNWADIGTISDPTGSVISDKHYSMNSWTGRIANVSLFDRALVQEPSVNPSTTIQLGTLPHSRPPDATVNSKSTITLNDLPKDYAETENTYTTTVIGLIGGGPKDDGVGNVDVIEILDSAYTSYIFEFSSFSNPGSVGHNEGGLGQFQPGIHQYKYDASEIGNVGNEPTLVPIDSSNWHTAENLKDAIEAQGISGITNIVNTNGILTITWDNMWDDGQGAFQRGAMPSDLADRLDLGATTESTWAPSDIIIIKPPTPSASRTLRYEWDTDYTLNSPGSGGLRLPIGADIEECITNLKGKLTTVPLTSDANEQSLWIDANVEDWELKESDASLGYKDTLEIEWKNSSADADDGTISFHDISTEAASRMTIVNTPYEVYESVDVIVIQHPTLSEKWYAFEWDGPTDDVSSSLLTSDYPDHPDIEEQYLVSIDSISIPACLDNLKAKIQSSPLNGHIDAYSVDATNQTLKITWSTANPGVQVRVLDASDGSTNTDVDTRCNISYDVGAPTIDEIGALYNNGFYIDLNGVNTQNRISSDISNSLTGWWKLDGRLSSPVDPLPHRDLPIGKIYAEDSAPPGKRVIDQDGKLFVEDPKPPDKGQVDTMRPPAVLASEPEASEWYITDSWFCYEILNRYGKSPLIDPADPAPEPPFLITDFWVTDGRGFQHEPYLQMTCIADEIGATYNLVANQDGTLSSPTIFPTSSATNYWNSQNLFPLISNFSEGEDPIITETPQTNLVETNIANDIVIESPKRMLEDGTYTKTVFSSRFSAPGGPEINSKGYLDIYHGEYSVYNALPWRNFEVRGDSSGEPNATRVVDHLGDRRGLRKLETNHCGVYGLDSLHGSPGYIKLRGTGFVELPYINMDTNTPTGINGINLNLFLAFHKISFSIWFRPTSLTPVDSTYPYFILLNIGGELVEAEPNLGAPFEIYIKEDGSIVCALSMLDDHEPTQGATYEWSSDPSLIKENEWHHLVVSYSGLVSDNPTLYLNGNSLSLTNPTLAGNELAWVLGFEGTPHSLRGCLGVRYNDEDKIRQGYFLGDIAEAALLGRTLDPSDVSEIYLAGVASDFANVSGDSKLLFWYRMGEVIDCDKRLYDFSGNGLHAHTIGSVSLAHRDDTKPSHHKIHRNIGRKLTTKADIWTSDQRSSDSDYINLPPILKFNYDYDNGNVTHPIPRSDFQYSWINNALQHEHGVESGHQSIFGHARKDGFRTDTTPYTYNEKCIQGFYTHDNMDNGTSYPASALRTITTWTKFTDLSFTNYPESDIYREYRVTSHSNGYNSFWIKVVVNYLFENYIQILIPYTSGGYKNYVFSSSNTEGGQAPSFTENVWYHIAVTHDGNDSPPKLYVNGVLFTYSGSPAISDDVSSGEIASVLDNRALALGDSNQFIDEVSIWHRALPESDIQNLYNSGEPVLFQEHTFNKSGLVSWYRCGDEIDHRGDPYALQDTITKIYDRHGNFHINLSHQTIIFSDSHGSKTLLKPKYVSAINFPLTSSLKGV